MLDIKNNKIEFSRLTTSHTHKSLFILLMETCVNFKTFFITSFCAIFFCSVMQSNFFNIFFNTFSMYISKLLFNVSCVFQFTPLSDYFIAISSRAFLWVYQFYLNVSIFIRDIISLDEKCTLCNNIYVFRTKFFFNVLSNYRVSSFLSVL